MSQSHPSSRSSSTTVGYTPQQFLTYLQSIKTFKHFDQSTLILQSQPPNKGSSLNIRIAEHQHIGLHDFLTDCITISRIHSDPPYKSTITPETHTTILSIQHVTDLLSQSKSNRSFLLLFYNHFFHFLSIVTQLFDEKIVSTKLRIRGPYLLMINAQCMTLLSSFLLSQITIIQRTMTLRSDGRYEMHLKQMKNLRYILHLVKNLLQFELFTFDFLQFEVVSNMVLFCQNESTEWSQSLSKLFDVVLMIQLPTHSVGILSKFTVDKLILLETKAILTTKAFRSFVITFIRFLIIHYHQTIIENNAMSLPFNHLDVIMNELFHLSHDHTKDIMRELWSADKLKTEFKTEYETKHKYESSAFLKGSMIGTDEDSSSIHTEEWNSNSLHLEDATSLPPKLSGKKRKRIEFEDTLDISNHTVGNEKKYKEFITEQCYLLIIDKILPFCMDFDRFYHMITMSDFAVYQEIIATLDAVLLHFIKREKWWHLSHIMSLYNALFEDKNVFTHFLQCLRSDDDGNVKDMASNMRYGIYSFIIWICYLHQLTPKPVICFFDDDFDANKALKDVDGNTKRDKLLKTKDAKMEGFECLKSVQRRITELLLSKSVLIQLMITTAEAWLMEDLLCNFTHIRDRYVLVKLLTLLLQDIEHLELNHVLEGDTQELNYVQRFIPIFQQFKRKIVSNPPVQPAPNPSTESLSHIPKHKEMKSKSKIVFRKQPLSIHMKRKRTDHIKKERPNPDRSGDIKRDSDDKPLFEHFTSHSMKIVNCIVNDTKHLLYQFVTSPPSKLRSKSKRQKPIEKKKPQTVIRTPNRSAPTPPVFEDRKDGNAPMDLSFLTSTLSSIQNVFDVPAANENANRNKNNKRMVNKKRRDEDDFDFDFDFQRISNINRTKKPVPPPSPTQATMHYQNRGPPQKKRKIAAEEENSEQLTDLLSYLCATPESGNKNKNKNKNKKDTISPRYPRPKAPTMRELDNADNDSNWTNVVNLNRY